MNEILFSTKLYQPSTLKNGVFNIILNIVLAIASLLSLISILIVGVNVANISTIIISVVVVFETKNKLRKESEYINCFAKASFVENELIITYYKYNVNGTLVDEFVEIIVPYKEIQTIEYSDRLMCLRIRGNIIDRENKRNTIYKTEHLMYIEDNKIEQWIGELQRRTNITLTYVDR